MFNCTVTDLNEKGVINLKKYKSTCTNHLTKIMDPAFLLGHLDPTNDFVTGGLNMAFMRQLLLEGKPLPKMLFVDVMVEKTQILIEHITNHHLGLCLTANIGENTAVVKMNDNFVTVNTQLLHITISNLWDLENQLWRLYIEANGIIHDFMLDIEDIPPLEDITNDES